MQRLTAEELKAKRERVARVVATWEVHFNPALQDMRTGLAAIENDLMPRLKRGQLAQTTHIRKEAMKIIKAAKRLRDDLVLLRDDVDRAK